MIINICYFLVFSLATWHSCGAIVQLPPRPLLERVDTALPPLLPSEDPFYRVPGDIEKFPPGSIINSRRTPNQLAVLGVGIKGAADRYQILYRTTDSLGNATATVLSVLIPEHADFSKVLSYQVAGDYAAADCAPSYSFQLGSDPDKTMNNLMPQAELLLMQPALATGWIVISPDFEGPTAAFCANILAGQATLDGIRAALQSFSITGLQSNATVTLWGYSGGSLASLAAAELQPSYAPDIHIAGVAVGGVEPNLIAVMENLNGVGTLVATAVVGLASQYPQLKAFIDDQLSYAWYNPSRWLSPNFKRDKLYAVKRKCLMGNHADFEGVSIRDLFWNPNFYYNEPIAVGVLNENGLGRNMPKIPIYIYHGIEDEISPIRHVDTLVQRYCSGGTEVTYDRLTLLPHFPAMLGGYRAFDWLTEKMNGSTTVTGRPEKCHLSTSFIVQDNQQWHAFWSFMKQVLATNTDDNFLDTVFTVLQRLINYTWSFEDSQAISKFIGSTIEGDLATTASLSPEFWQTIRKLFNF